MRGGMSRDGWKILFCEMSCGRRRLLGTGLSRNGYEGKFVSEDRRVVGFLHFPQFPGSILPAERR